jgi:hypothetical protein
LPVTTDYTALTNKKIVVSHGKRAKKIPPHGRFFKKKKERKMKKKHANTIALLYLPMDSAATLIHRT